MAAVVAELGRKISEEPEDRLLVDEHRPFN
jgi:hypothetical protein